MTVRFMLLATLLVGTSACVTTAPPSKPALSYYDECASQTSSFPAIAACGKQRRNAACQANKTCSSIGNSVVAFADSLALSVTRREMTEAEAMRRWAEFKITQERAQHQLDLQAAAADNANRPISCQRTGNFVYCD
jgi:hypothetical protein